MLRGEQEGRRERGKGANWNSLPVNYPSCTSMTRMNSCSGHVQHTDNSQTEEDRCDPRIDLRSRRGASTNSDHLHEEPVQPLDVCDESAPVLERRLVRTGMWLTFKLC